MYTKATSLPNLYIRNIIPTDTSIPFLGYRALSGWGYTDFHASVNFAFWAFSEVQHRVWLGSTHARLVAFGYHAREACKGTFVRVLREKRGEVWLRHLLGTVAIAEMS
jgi:hypothetical protein